MINLFHHIKNANVNIFYFYHLSISNSFINIKIFILLNDLYLFISILKILHLILF